MLVVTHIILIYSYLNAQGLQAYFEVQVERPACRPPVLNSTETDTTQFVNLGTLSIANRLYETPWAPPVARATVGAHTIGDRV